MTITRCPTCGLSDPALHPCDDNRTLIPCHDAFHAAPQHAWRLRKMANFLRDLVALSGKYNDRMPYWEAERNAEVAALEAGADAIDRGN